MAHEGDPTPFKNYYVLYFGERAFEDLERRAHSNMKMGYVELVELWESRKAILAGLKGKAA
jgi:hypothetical protein